jgi:tetratricopeptide (TPR) repeat protein
MGRYQEALLMYQALAEAEGPYASRASYWLADADYLRGRFRRAISSLTPIIDDDYLRGEALRLTGHVYRVNALFDSAVRAYQEARELGRRSNSPAMEAKALTNLAETLSWIRPTEGLEWARQALASNLAIDNRVEVVKAHVAVAIAAQGDGAWGRARHEIEAATTLARRIGYRGGLVSARVAEVFQMLVSGRSETVWQLHRDIHEGTEKLGGKAFWLDVVEAWMGRGGKPRACWLGGTEAARSRWVRVLESRRA